MRRSVPGGERPAIWLIKGLGPGGAERLLLAQAAHRSPCRRTIVAFTRADRNHLVEPFRAAGVEVICLSHADDRPGRWLLRLANLLRRERPGVLHVHSPALAAPARLLGTLVGARLVYTEHNRWADYRRPTRLANALTYPLDDVQFAVSEGVRRTVWRPLRTRIETLHHGVPADLPIGADARQAARTALGAGVDDLVVLTIANLRAAKAPFDMLVAARTALATQPRLRFAWVGQGPLEEAFRAAVAEAGLGDRFAFLGYHPDARTLLPGADLFALSSRHEGLPVVLMEAQHAGIPVVAPDVGGVAEAIGGPEPSGVLVPAGDPIALGRAIAALAADPERRTRFENAARARSPRFDGSSAFARLEAAYSGRS